MKLPKQTRKRLFNGEVVEVRYPSSENPPLRSGASYSIETDKGSVGRCRVMRQRRTPAGWTIALAHDIQAAPHLLARRSELGYTAEPALALSHEPEAVDPSEIADYRSSKEARERHQAERTEDIADLLGAMTELRAAINAMPPDRKRHMSRTLWTLRSRLDSAERELRRRIAA